MQRRGRRLCSAALACGVLLAGCGGTDGQDQAPPGLTNPDADPVSLSDDEVKAVLDDMPIDVSYRDVPHDSGTVVVGTAKRGEAQTKFAVLTPGVLYNRRIFPRGAGFVQKSGANGIDYWFIAPSAQDARLAVDINDALCRVRFSEDFCNVV